jgi:hypothetical protein
MPPKEEVKEPAAAPGAEKKEEPYILPPFLILL